MKDSEKKSKSNQEADPSAILSAAIEKLDILIQHNEDALAAPHIHNIEIKNGQLVPTKRGSLQKIINLTCCLIAPLFSSGVRDEQIRKREKINKEIAEAVDTVKGHLALIPRLQEGSPSEKSLAKYANSVISKYNQMVQQLPHDSWISRFACYIYEKSDLLLDNEIRKRSIIPNKSTAAHDTLKELGVVLGSLSLKKLIHSSASPTHKKPIMVMLDAFRLKASQALKERGTLREIMDLVRTIPVDIDDDSSSDLIWMRQLVEVSPGSFAKLSGAFKRRFEGKLMSIPILDHFCCTFHTHRPGYPRATEHAGWALSEALVDANPLRADRTPLFSIFEERTALISKNLLINAPAIEKAKRILQLKRQVFDKNRVYFMGLLRKIVVEIARGVEVNEEIEAFFALVLASDDPYMTLSNVYQYWAYYFVSQPMQKLREMWLSGSLPILRTGTSAERLQGAIQVLEGEFEKELSNIQLSVEATYVRVWARLLHTSVKNILLQYVSDKMGFAASELSKADQHLQFCAFQQGSSFYEEMEMQEINEKSIFEWLEKLFIRDLEALTRPNIAEMGIISELRGYFAGACPI